MKVPSYQLETQRPQVHDLESYVRRAGEHARSPHRHDFWQLAWFTGATGVHGVDMVEHGYEPGTMLLLPSGAVHAFLGVEMGGTLLHFREEHVSVAAADARFLLELRALAIETPMCRPSPEDLGRVEPLLEWLRAESEREPSDPLQFRALLHALLGLYKRWVPAPHMEDDYLRFITRVELRYTAHDAIPEYAQALGITGKRLYFVTHQAIGQPPGYLLTKRLLLEAQRLLVHSDARISTIAFDLGFSDAAYFSRFFRRHLSVAPSAYRARRRASL